MMNNDELLEGEVFYPYLPPFLLAVYGLAGLGAVCFERLLHTENMWWLGSLVLSMLAGGLLATHYFAHTVTLLDTAVVIQHGFLRVSTVTIPLWQLRFTTTQSLLGRVGNYGSIHFFWNGEEIEMRDIASLKKFRYAVLQRQQALLTPMLVQPHIVMHPHRLVLAHESEDDLDYYR